MECIPYMPENNYMWWQNIRNVCDDVRMFCSQVIPRQWHYVANPVGLIQLRDGYKYSRCVRTEYAAVTLEFSTVFSAVLNGYWMHTFCDTMWHNAMWAFVKWQTNEQTNEYERKQYFLSRFILSWLPTAHYCSFNAGRVRRRHHRHLPLSPTHLFPRRDLA